MRLAHRVYVVFGVTAAAVTCTQAGMRGLDEYRGSRLERVAELPEVARSAGKPGWSGPMSATDGDPFRGVCAETLRIAKDGRELRLLHTQVQTKESNENGVATTELVSAVAEYAVVTPEWLKGGTSPRLRVDCIKGRATGWVGE